MPGGLEIFLVYSNNIFSKPGRLRKLVKINLSCYQLFHFVLREGAKFIETGAGQPDFSGAEKSQRPVIFSCKKTLPCDFFLRKNSLPCDFFL